VRRKGFPNISQLRCEKREYIMRNVSNFPGRKEPFMCSKALAPSDQGIFDSFSTADLHTDCAACYRYSVKRSSFISIRTDSALQLRTGRVAKTLTSSLILHTLSLICQFMLVYDTRDRKSLEFGSGRFRSGLHVMPVVIMKGLVALIWWSERMNIVSMQCQLRWRPGEKGW